MQIAFWIFKSLIISFVAFLYSDYIYSLLDLVTKGDLLKYQDLFDGAHNFTSFSELLFYQNSVIGTLDPFYILFIRYLFSPYLAFYEYVQIQVFVFVFVYGCIFFRRKKHFIEPLRYLFYICSLFSVYSLGLSTTLLRLQLAMIFIFIASILHHRAYIRNMFYLFALLTHISTIMIVIPLFFTRLPLNIRPFSFNFPSLKIPRNIRIFRLTLALLAIVAFVVISFNKITTWLPVMLSFIAFKDFVSALFVFILLYPLIANKKTYSLESLKPSNSSRVILPLLPIFLTTLLIGGFRTLILAFYMSADRLSLTQSSFFNSRSILISVYPYFCLYSLVSGLSFIDKLYRTGYGY